MRTVLKDVATDDVQPKRNKGDQERPGHGRTGTSRGTESLRMVATVLLICGRLYRDRKGVESTSLVVVVVVFVLDLGLASTE